MFWLVLILLIAAAACIFILWAICPAFDKRSRMKPFQNFHYAHRGLWDLKRGIPENSLPAFQAAADAGYAIELDVHLTSDGRMIVFHDDTTGRICGENYNIERTDWPTLSALYLSGTTERIPLLSDVLTEVAGRVPLLIELKLPHSDLSLCPAVMELLDSYRGPYLIESFNTFGLRWLKKHRPDVIRGQLSTRFPRGLNVPGPVKWLTTMLLVNALGRPHFIAYNLKYSHTPGFLMMRRIFRTPVFFWTIRTPEQYRECRERGGTAIFERIRPDDHSCSI